MGIELVHAQVVAGRVDFTALVTGNHSRGNAGCAQHEGHGSGKVDAEAIACLEQETVNDIRTHRVRLEGVAEGLAIEMPEQCLNHGLGVLVSTAQLHGPGAAAWIALGGQLQGPLKTGGRCTRFAQRFGP